jgi:hypothetical protein
MQLELSDTEARILREALNDYLSGLRREVARTEQHEYRHMLVERQDLCERLCQELGAAAAK